MIKEIQRMMQPLRVKLSNLVGRGVLSLVNNSETTKKLQGLFFANEKITDIEHFSEYGLETVPLTGAQILGVFKGGNRSNGVITNVHDRRYRPVDLAEGEVVIYTDEDGKASLHRIHFKRGKIIHMLGTVIVLGTVAVALTLVNALFMTAVYNIHTHPESGGGTTSPPNQLGVVGTHTTTQTSAS
jgi:phage baseplate assembly protein V